MVSRIVAVGRVRSISVTFKVPEGNGFSSLPIVAGWNPISAFDLSNSLAVCRLLLTSTLAAFSEVCSALESITTMASPARPKCLPGFRADSHVKLLGQAFVRAVVGQLRNVLHVLHLRRQLLEKRLPRWCSSSSPGGGPQQAFPKHRR